MRRNFLPEYKGCGRHSEYGEIVRPLARTRAGKLLEATACDATFRWEDEGICLRAEVWKDVVLSEDKVGAKTVNVIAVFDPRYKEPWLLATNLEVTAEVVWRLYRDRWAVEHLPLVAKPMLGCGQAFVFGQESRLRLPELALLCGMVRSAPVPCGNILSYVAATCCAVATGFWDRVCRATCGRLRRVLNRLDFSELPVLGEQLRKKASVTSHLTTGVEGHRRQKTLKLEQGVLLSA